MRSKVEIKFTENDEFDHERTMTYSQNNVRTTEDLEFAFVKAALSWGFDDCFFGYPSDVFSRKAKDE